MQAVNRRVISWGAAALVVLAALGIYFAVTSSGKTMHVKAEFSRAVGLYTGSSVRILGVPVGKITKIEPHGSSVTVYMTYNGKYKVPATAVAAIVPPSIVGDRYVQLTPAYTSGPVLQDTATVGCADNDPQCKTPNAVPAELDDIFQSLDDLNRALGPQGANKTGALSRLISVGAQDLGNGNGQRLHDALHDLSDLVATLDNNRGDLVGVIDHLGSFTSTLANDDTNVRKVNDDLSQVADQLAGEREDLSQAVENLAVALGEVQSLVKNSRLNLTSDVHGLASITDTLVKEKRALTEFLDVAPEALSNLQKAFDPGTESLATRGNFDFTQNPAQELLPFLCSTSLVTSNPALQAACKSLQQSAPERSAIGRPKTGPSYNDTLSQLLAVPS
jgi:phospholipid/cholesterol/gamma-HCH transport system substrate-binding protein